jgi:uncharacterized protein (DUF1800 family)
MWLRSRTSHATRAWVAYEPSEQVPWDWRRVVHLHRRAGFAATWDEIRRDLADGPGPSIDRLLAGRARGRHVPDDFESTAAMLADAATAGSVAQMDPRRLKAWWLYRMMFSPDPVGERLTLMWHDHFATSNRKVDNLAAMLRQNTLFRKLARAPFGELLRAVLRDPALLIWLDAPANREGQANENLARELMELFTLGIGHYTESDVREAARALTGWTVSQGTFRHIPAQHDDGEKVILGRRGRWTGDDLVAMLLDHPATAERLAARICGLFLGENVVGAGAISELAEGLRRNDLSIGWAVETVLRSRPFFAEANLGNRVLGPTEFVVGAVRALEVFDPPASTLALAEWTARLGQDLFYPPNVGGWPGGRAWVTSQCLIGRINFAEALVRGQLFEQGQAFRALGLAETYGHARDFDTVLTFFSKLLLGVDPPGEWRDRLGAASGPASPALAETARRAVAMILSSPEAQLA